MNAGFRLSMAARVLRSGGLLAYPTEAVWGLGCDPCNGDALQRLLKLKGRDTGKGLILVAADMAQLGELLAGVSSAQRRQLNASWPGSTTWLLPHRESVHPLVHGRFSTVAVRVSAHPLVAKLCRHFGGPVVSTSANPQGRRPARDGIQVRRYFAGHIDYILNGKLGGAERPSEIRDLASGRLLRAG